MMELGFRSLDSVREMLVDGWRDMDVIHDLAGLPRVLMATRI
jgi:hypothetical protein